MGLVNRPQVLFLDEPTTGLDPEARSAMWAEVARLAARDGITVLLTTHYLEEADRLAARLAIVDAGRVVAEGRPDELKAALRGDTLVVELEAGGSANGLGRLAVEQAGRVAGVGDVRLDGGVLRARAADGARALPAVLSALDAAGVPVASVTVHRPSLDDVYLQFAGRDFASADAAGSESPAARPTGH
jgi:ABC-2 type transport system ATP-binding protein